MERFLTWGYIFIFVIWQFAQAWWMRVPFKEIALRKMASSEDNSPTNLGIVLNIFSPMLWMAIGGSLLLCSFTKFIKFYRELQFNFHFILIFLMGMMGSITFYLLKNLHKDFLKDSKIAAFSGYFALGYWGFYLIMQAFFFIPCTMIQVFFMI